MARVVGLILMLPALGLLVGQLLVASILTMLASLRDGALITNRGGELVGLGNDTRLVDVPGAIGRGLITALAAWLISWIAGIAVALATRGGRSTQVIGRAATGIALALLAPSRVAVVLLAGAAPPSSSLVVLATLAAATPALTGAARHRVHRCPAWIG